MDLNEKQISIIESAEELFAEHGFAGTSVRDIAEKAHINIAMISYYFGSKEKLLEALFSYRSGSSIITLENILNDPKLLPIDKLNFLIDYYIDKFHNQQCFHKVMMREQVANYKNVTTEFIHEFRKRNQNLVKRLIHEGQKDGTFKKNIDIPLLMATIIGTVSHMVTTQHYYKEINNLQDMPDDHFQKLIKKKLSTHLKTIFKATITNEI